MVPRTPTPSPTRHTVSARSGPMPVSHTTTVATAQMSIPAMITGSGARRLAGS